MTPKKILFISHDSNRTGAPILLLRFIKLIAKLPEYNCTILTGINGPLISEFKETCETHIWEPDFNNKLESDTLRYYFNKFKIEKFRKKVKLSFHKERILNKLKAKQFDLIIANTVASAIMVKELLQIGYTNITSYIHELEYGLNTYVTENERNVILKNSNNFWVPSLAVKNNLVKNHNISSEKIDVLVSAIEDNLIEINLSNNKLVSTKTIGCVGTLDYRKGADLFIEVAKKTIESYSGQVLFKWFGADLNSDYYKKIQQQIHYWGLQSRIIINGNTKNIVSEIAQFDIFLLTSREDPYPLVVLEAAQLGKPILAFDENAGGTVELIENGAGIIVPYLDINAMSQQCIFLLENNKIATEIAKTAKEKVSKKHNINNAFSNFIYLLNAQL